MVKYVLIALFAIVIAGSVGGYYYTKEPYPSVVEFRGHILDSRKDNNNSTDKELKIFSYRDKTTTHLLMFAVRNESPISLSDLALQYLGRFQYQGYTFVDKGSRKHGVRNNERLYMAEAKSFDGLIVYIEQSSGAVTQSEEELESILSDVENFKF